MDTKTKRVGNVTAGFMVATALLIDGIQFLLTLTALLIPLAMLCTFLSAIAFGIWFTILDVKYIGAGGGRKFLIALTATVAELIPVIDALPVTTAGVIGIIVQSRIEDARANIGKKATPRTAMATIRAQKMQAARAQRADAARASREADQQARHGQTGEEPA